MVAIISTMRIVRPSLFPSRSALQSRVSICRPIFIGVAKLFAQHPPASINCALLRPIQCEFKSQPISLDNPSFSAFKARRLASDDSKWQTFMRQLGNDWFLVVAVSFTAVGSALINITTLRIIGKLTNLLGMSFDSKAALDLAAAIRGPSLSLTALFATQGFLSFLYTTLVSRFGERIASGLRSELFASLIQQDIAFFDTKKSGELVERIGADVSEFKHSLKICISQGLKHMTQVIAAVSQLATTSLSLTSNLLIVGPIAYYLGSFYGGFLRQLSRRAKEIDSEASSMALEALSNIKTVRSFSTEEFECTKYDGMVTAAREAHALLGFHLGLFQGFTNFAIGSIVTFVLHFGGQMVINREISGGELMSYLLTVQTAQKSIANLLVMYSQAIKAVAAFDRITDYIHLRPEIALHGGVELSNINGDIEFHQVQFSYPTRKDSQVFKSLDLSIPAGQVYALCGSSGAGKSTIAALIERFYDVDAGSVTIDGVDVRELNPQFLRRNIGFIHQEPILFSGTILENIMYGSDDDRSLDDIKIAAKAANADTFIESLPEGYDTVVGERGATLSGGQKQRIAIARALLKNPKVLIFDEATSALDAESERSVQTALDNLMKGRTVIIIAHRLSTIKNADRIIVLGKGGRILEAGTHQELLRLGSEYANLYRTMHFSD